MKRIKKIVAIAAVSMLLCGFICQAAEGDEEPEIPGYHSHLYYFISSTCTGSNTEYQHTYLNGSTGEYSTCYVVRFAYRDLYRCNIDNCGDQIEIIRTVSRHMNCGQ